LRAVDAGLFEGAIEERARRADERPAAEVFLIARLLADEHHGRRLLPFAENRLRPCAPEVACLAVGSFFAKLVERPPHDVRESPTDEPTQVNSLLKSTPSIFPRERRIRFCARI